MPAGLFVKRHYTEVQHKIWDDIMAREERIHEQLTKKKTEDVKTRNNQDKHLTVHLIPYSWTKVGNKKTLDQSYAGTKNGLSKEKVSLMLDNVFY